MASAGSRSGDRHRHDPVAYRVPADVRPALEEHMKLTGLGPSAVITRALREYLAGRTGEQAAGTDPGQ